MPAPIVRHRVSHARQRRGCRGHPSRGLDPVAVHPIARRSSSRPRSCRPSPPDCRSTPAVGSHAPRDLHRPLAPRTRQYRGRPIARRRARRGAAVRDAHPAREAHTHGARRLRAARSAWTTPTSGSPTSCRPHPAAARQLSAGRESTWHRSDGSPRREPSSVGCSRRSSPPRRRGDATQLEALFAADVISYTDGNGVKLAARIPVIGSNPGRQVRRRVLESLLVGQDRRLGGGERATGRDALRGRSRHDPADTDAPRPTESRRLLWVMSPEKLRHVAIAGA